MMGNWWGSEGLFEHPLEHRLSPGLRVNRAFSEAFGPVQGKAGRYLEMEQRQ